MHPLVDQLAAVSGVRDLERLDCALAQLLSETLGVPVVEVFVSISDGGRTHWLRRSHQVRGAAQAPVAPAWIAPEDLPAFDELPVLAHCARSQLSQQARAGGVCLSAFPLFSDPDSQGVVLLHTARPLSAKRQQMMFSLLHFYANFRDLVTENERDMLTGLLNRKTFDETFSRLAMDTVFCPADETDRRAGSLAAPCWLAVADLDHFKRVNDQFGHLIGDEVLLLSARLMRSSFRYSDRVFRFGGEEFVLLLRHAETTGAMAALETFRQRVAAHAYPQIGQITVSLGYTRIDPDDTPGSAFERADKAVYAAKEDGRNRVLCFEELVAAGRLPAQAKTGSVDFF